MCAAAKMRARSTAAVFVQPHVRAMRDSAESAISFSLKHLLGRFVVGFRFVFIGCVQTLLSAYKRANKNVNLHRYTY